MKFKQFFILIGLFIAIQSCNYKNAPGYNTIVFSDPVKSVADSIVVFENLLYKLPKAEVVNFHININDKLIINNTTIGLWNDIETDSNFILTIEELKKFSDSEKLRLFTLMTFLRKNEIGGTYFNERLNLFFFTYREPQFYEVYNDYRDIVIKKKIGIGFYNSYQVLDEKEELLLVAPIDARIY